MTNEQFEDMRKWFASLTQEQRDDVVKYSLQPEVAEFLDFSREAAAYKIEEVFPSKIQRTNSEVQAMMDAEYRHVMQEELYSEWFSAQ